MDIKIILNIILNVVMKGLRMSSIHVSQQKTYRGCGSEEILLSQGYSKR